MAESIRVDGRYAALLAEHGQTPVELGAPSRVERDPSGQADAAGADQLGRPAIQVRTPTRD
jgi:hypothetical protein